MDVAFNSCILFIHIILFECYINVSSEEVLSKIKFVLNFMLILPISLIFLFKIINAEVPSFVARPVAWLRLFFGQSISLFLALAVPRTGRSAASLLTLAVSRTGRSADSLLTRNWPPFCQFAGSTVPRPGLFVGSFGSSVPRAGLSVGSSLPRAGLSVGSSLPRAGLTVGSSLPRAWPLTRTTICNLNHF